MNLEIEIGMLKAKVHYLEQMLEATIRKIDDNQPERSKREDCEKGYHIRHGNSLHNLNEWKCDNCDAVIRRCGALNPMET